MLFSRPMMLAVLSSVAFLAPTYAKAQTAPDGGLTSAQPSITREQAEKIALEEAEQDYFQSKCDQLRDGGISDEEAAKLARSWVESDSASERQKKLMLDALSSQLAKLTAQANSAKTNAESHLAVDGLIALAKTTIGIGDFTQRAMAVLLRIKDDHVLGLQKESNPDNKIHKFAIIESVYALGVSLQKDEKKAELLSIKMYQMRLDRLTYQAANQNIDSDALLAEYDAAASEVEILAAKRASARTVAFQYQVQRQPLQWALYNRAAKIEKERLEVELKASKAALSAPSGASPSASPTTTFQNDNSLFN